MLLSRFDPTRADVRIWARLIGPRGAVWCEMVLDTGSSKTVVDERLLARMGYNLLEGQSVVIATAGGRTEAIIVTVRQLAALGMEAINLPVLAMPLWQSLGVDGLLGLDFLRRRNLFCNFGKGILLTLPFARNFLHRCQLVTHLFAAL